MQERLWGALSLSCALTLLGCVFFFVVVVVVDDDAPVVERRQLSQEQRKEKSFLSSLRCKTKHLFDLL